MKKTKKIIVILLGACVFISWSTFHQGSIASLCDSPLVGDHSGAPGESNCTACHGGSPNTGRAILEFHVGNDSTYIPGYTYACDVKMTQKGLTKFGFVDLALKNAGNKTIGNFNIIDSVNTRKYTLGIRDYISHTPCGADADTTGKNEWKYSWTAPTTNVGNITLYISALAANHDHATTGDSTYTKTIMLKPASAEIEEIPQSIKFLKIYPNPSADFISISYENLSFERTEIKIIDIQGRKVGFLSWGNENKGQINKTFSLKEMKIHSGIYLIIVSKGDKHINKKIIVL